MKALIRETQEPKERFLSLAEASALVDQKVYSKVMSKIMLEVRRRYPKLSMRTDVCAWVSTTVDKNKVQVSWKATTPLGNEVLWVILSLMPKELGLNESKEKTNSNLSFTPSLPSLSS